MPPLSLQRQAITALSSARAACSSSSATPLRSSIIIHNLAYRSRKHFSTTIPQTAAAATTAARSGSAALSSSTSTSEPKKLPPESPHSIVVPVPPQSAEQRLPPVRGHLPVPRAVFSKKDGPKGPDHVARVLPRSAAEVEGLPPRSAAEARRRRMTDLRRRNLASGLQGLYARRAAADASRASRARARYEANAAAARAPEGLDDALTRTTVRRTTRETAVAADPGRFRAAKTARARAVARETRRSQARRDALAQLYMAAGSFIVDEAELERRVELLFTGDHHSKTGYSTGGAGNNWDAWGAPATVAELRAMMMGTTTGVYESNRQPASRTTLRQKVVSEELTGGKLD